ncbi:hypothetical protein [Streptomyces sp. NPDC056192]
MAAGRFTVVEPVIAQTALNAACWRFRSCDASSPRPRATRPQDQWPR